jgi:hypothetical protein
MRNLLLVSLLLPACTSDSVTTTVTDNPITAAARGDRIVVAANEATEQTGFGCGGGTAFLGRSVLFVSGDRGETFERILPTDERPLVRMASQNGVFYAVAHGNDGTFGIVTSDDGVEWTEVAGASRYAQDFAAADDLMVVAHATGVMTSPDGSAWTDHDLGEGYYQASVARANGLVAIGTNVDGKLHLSSDATTWRTQQIAGLDGIDQVIASGDSLLVTGYGTGRGPVLARVDLAGATASITSDRSWATRTFLTPAGLLDTNGALMSTDNASFGQLTSQLSPFLTAAVDGSTVVIVRDTSIAISRDGGATFDPATLPLPIVQVEIESEAPSEFGPRG